MTAIRIATTALLGLLACDPGQEGTGSSLANTAQGAAPGSREDPVGKAIEAARKDGRYVYQDPGGRFDAVVHVTGAVSFREHGVDLTPTAIRLAGPEAWDPASTSGARREFLERTAHARAELASQWNEGTSTAALRALNEDLEALWKRSELSAQRRRAIAFAWWDDTAEGAAAEGMSPVDAARHAHGGKARSTIIKFLRERAAADPSARYPAAELEALNASRHSKARFAPGRISAD